MEFDPYQENRNNFIPQSNSRQKQGSFHGSAADRTSHANSAAKNAPINRFIGAVEDDLNEISNIFSRGNITSNSPKKVEVLQEKGSKGQVVTSTHSSFFNMKNMNTNL